MALANMAGGMSFWMWKDPYLLGYLNFTGSFFAKAETNGKAKPEDIGFAMMDAFSAVSNMNGAEIARYGVELAESRDPDFESGMQDAMTVALYTVGLLRDEDSDPLVAKCMGLGTASMDILPGGDMRSAVSGAMMQMTFVKQVRSLKAEEHA